MKAFSVIALLATTIFLSTSGHAIEEHVTIDDNLKIVVSNPTSNTPPKAVVLLVHGWVSQADEVGGLFKQLSQELREVNIASIRVNIRGESEQELSGYRLTSTFSSRVRDAELALGYLQHRYAELPIGLVGFSLGGATVLSLAGRYASDIDSVVLWSSAGNPELIVQRLPAAKVQEILTKGEAEIEDFRTLVMTKQHLLGMLGHDVFEKIDQYKGAMLSIRGSKDFISPFEDTLFEIANANLEESILLYGANHTFNVFEDEKLFSPRVIYLTKDWLLNTLTKG